MKSFLKTFLAVCLANLLFIFIGLFFFFVVFVASIASIFKGQFENEIPQQLNGNSILVIPLDESIKEYGDGELDYFSAFSQDGNAIGIIQLQSLIVKASKDERIKAIFISGSGFHLSSRTIVESLIHSLNEFKKTGKKIYAYADNYFELGYVVSSVADKIFMHPQGNFEWDGMGAKMTFYTKLLKKIGVDMQIFYAGNFKSATEPFRNEKMSSYNREQLTRLIQVSYAQMLDVISKNRGISVAQLKKHADSLDIFFAEQALDKKMVDELHTYQFAKQRIAKAIVGNNKTWEKVDFISHSQYADYFSDSELYNTLTGDHQADKQIALVYLEGAISNESVGNAFSSEKSIVADEVIDLLKDLEKDNDIKSVVLRINSPGGSASASESIFQAIQKLKTKKPVVVSMSQVAASGGYYIACAGDSVFCTPSTITGSIGVFAMIPSAKKFFEDELYLTYDEVKTSPHALPKGALLSHKLDALQSMKIQENINHIYDVFLGRVAQSRKLDRSQVLSVAEGRVWGGQDALSKKLVDAIGNEYDALRAASILAKTSRYEVVVYPKEKSWIEKQLAKLQMEAYAFLGITAFLESDIYQSWKQVKAIKEQYGKAQMSMPQEIRVE